MTVYGLRRVEKNGMRCKKVWVDVALLNKIYFN